MGVVKGSDTKLGVSLHRELCGLFQSGYNIRYRKGCEGVGLV
jgi:hypothetical protein